MSLFPLHTLYIQFSALSLILSFTIFSPLVILADSYTYTERELKVKRALLYKFGKFVQWPNRLEEFEDFRLCVIGDEPFGAELDSLDGKTVRGKPLTVMRLKNLDDLSCHILFISRSEEEHLEELLAQAHSMGIMTVGDIKDFAHRGGMVAMILDDKKIKLEINLSGAEQAGITISSRLLRLGTIVNTTKSVQE